MSRKVRDLSQETLNLLHMMGLPNRALEPISRSWSFCANDIELDPAQDLVQATIPSELRGRQPARERLKRQSQGLRGRQPRKGKAEATIPSGWRGWALAMRTIKCLKGNWWMPWHAQAMKDVIRCDKLRGGANTL